MQSLSFQMWRQLLISQVDTTQHTAQKAQVLTLQIRLATLTKKLIKILPQMNESLSVHIVVLQTLGESSVELVRQVESLILFQDI